PNSSLYADQHPATPAVSPPAPGPQLLPTVTTAANANTATDLTTSTEPVIAITALKVGQYLQFGRYCAPGYTMEDGSADICWRILDVDQSSGKVLLLADRILDIKPFDVAESGLFNKDRDGNTYDRDQLASYSQEALVQFRGNSDWETSNIRVWLNSDTEQVTYTGQPPISKGTDDACNGYHNQAGFLSAFTPREKALIAAQLNTTPVNALNQTARLSGNQVFKLNRNILKTDYNFNDTLSKTTLDKVFLLSLAEVKKYLYDRKFSIFALPTPAALRSDKSTWTKAYRAAGINNYLWVLRTPDGTTSHLVCIVGTGKNEHYAIDAKYAAAAGLGIRPAMSVKLKGIKLTGNGSETEPYRLMK
ncbi:MAG TPA: DUF6273 domain-containing protein, partial [Bacillota bacterium]|nr:DUF6273 domain-containing protein [Bacillota bacterium]